MRAGPPFCGAGDASPLLGRLMCNQYTFQGGPGPGGAGETPVNNSRPGVRTRGSGAPGAAPPALLGQPGSALCPPGDWPLNRCLLFLTPAINSPLSPRLTLPCLARQPGLGSRGGRGPSHQFNIAVPAPDFSFFSVKSK